MPKNLPLPDGCRATVFRTLCQLIEQAPALQNVVDAENWYTLDDRHEHEESFGNDLVTAVRITPQGGAAGPLSNVAQSSPLQLKIEVCTPGPWAEDLMNLWETIETTVFTGDGAAAAMAALATALATLSRPAQVISLRLSEPALDPNPAAYAQGLLYAAGSIIAEMKVRK